MGCENAVRYKKIEGTTSQKRKQFKKQLEDFERKAKKGKVICISDLMGNAENLHVGGKK